ncbi:unnamed protein product [Cunninghamella blakesleeana]
MSNIKQSGDISMHCIQFQLFIEDDNRFLVFHIALNDTVMGDIKSNPNARLCWTMPKTKEYYKLKGKFYISSSPMQITRFPPPKPNFSNVAAADYWENERKKHWKGLSDKGRAVYTWPSHGDTRANRTAFSCQTLKHFDQQVQPSGNGGLFTNNNKENIDKLKVVHDIAMDNFCLLIYKITEVEHFDYNSFPAINTLYSIVNNQWMVKELNP